MKYLEQKYTKTEDLMLVNIMYNKPVKATEYKDSIDVIYKDLSNGRKYLEHIEDPKMEIYWTKPEHQNFDYNKFVQPLDHVEPVMTTCKGVLRTIAQLGGPNLQSYYKQCRETHQFNKAKNLHKYKYVMASDYDPESYYRIQWELEYSNDRPKPISKIYSDIEVDGINHPGFVSGGVVPINAITLLDEETKTSFTFALRNDKNPQIAELEDNMEPFYAQCHELFDDFYGVWKYKVVFYDEKDEMKMLQDYFQLIHTLKRDFIMFWNMDYDANYFMDRIKEFGYNPADIMCHKDFPIKQCYYYKDKKNFSPKTKKDSFTVSDYTQYIDQMLLYSQIRKGQAELGSVRLNIVGHNEIGEEKIDYSEEANIKTLPYVDYVKFLIYNIKDCLLQYGIERKTHDLENLYTRSVLNQVPYKKVFSQTVLLRNRTYVNFLRDQKYPYIVGNNCNIDYERNWDEPEKDDEDEVGFAGAFNITGAVKAL